jgi:hypothetical protein
MLLRRRLALEAILKSPARKSSRLQCGAGIHKITIANLSRHRVVAADCMLISVKEVVLIIIFQPRSIS